LKLFCRPSFASVLLILPVFFLAACDRPTDVQRANKEGVLLVGNTAEPKALDLQLVTGVPESKVISALFEGLIGNDSSDDQKMQPGVATRWEHNKDMTEWVFHLRPEAKWSDGAPLTAEDFIFSYHRMLSPGLAAAYAPMLHSIRNAETYNRDLRGHILCGLDESFPLPWTVLGKANFEGQEVEGAEDLGKTDFEELSHDDKKRLLASKGLDRLNQEQIEAILADPSLFDWPSEVPADVRGLVLQRLLDYLREGEPDLFEKAKLGLAAPDPHTLKVTLREPVPYLPSIVRHSTWYPVPKHVVLKFGKMTDRFTDWSLKGNLVGNGPFQLSEWRFNHYIEVRRNPHYWDAANVGLNGIRYYPIENPYTEARAFLAGQLHTTYTFPAELLPRARKSFPQYLKEEPYVGTIFLRLNTTRKGLEDKRVRQALAWAINRADYCQYIYEGYSPAKCLTPKLGEYRGPEVLDFDLAKAKSLLAETGHPEGKGIPTLAILTSRPHPAADALQQSFRALGIRVTIEQKDWGSYIAAQQSLNFDMALAGWIGDYLDPTTFLDMWTKGNGNNNTGWDSPQYSGLLREAALQPDTASRYRTLAEAEGILMDEMPILPIAWYTRLYLHRPEVKGWYPLVLDNHPWKTISLDP
jgi:oligopeptide transport system substrate-binding protein